MLKKLLLPLAFALVVTAAPAFAGPPLICHPIEIGAAPSLPWSSAPGWNGALGSYDLARLSDDTVSLLTPQTPVDVRRETLRRAALYAAGRAGLPELRRASSSPERTRPATPNPRRGSTPAISSRRSVKPRG
jgi:hypothetical protein